MGEPDWKFGIMHPSDRPLGPNYDGKEVWGADSPRLFDSREEAQAHIAERLKQYPNSDWTEARVLRCRPGKPRVHPQWEWKETSNGTETGKRRSRKF